MRPQIPPARDQGQRPTCLAFATSSAHAISRGKGASYEALSEEMLFWGACRILERVGGLTVDSASQTLSSTGQCSLQLWPYDDSPAPTKQPSKQALRDGAGRLARCVAIHRSYAETLRFLMESMPVVFTFQVFVGLWEPVRGFVYAPQSSEILDDRHAMLAVGAFSDQHGNQWVVARNSWGAGWGDQGHCYLPADFFNRFVQHAYIVELVSEPTQ